MSYWDEISARLAALTGIATPVEARQQLREFDVRDIEAVRVSEGGGTNGGSQPVPDPLAVFDFSDPASVVTSSAEGGYIVAQAGLSPIAGALPPTLPFLNNTAINGFDALYDLELTGPDWDGVAGRPGYGTRTINGLKVLDMPAGQQVLFAGDFLTVQQDNLVVIVCELDEIAGDKGLFKTHSGDYVGLISWADPNGTVRWSTSYAYVNADQFFSTMQLLTLAPVEAGPHVICLPYWKTTPGIYVDGILYEWRGTMVDGSDLDLNHAPFYGSLNVKLNTDNVPITWADFAARPDYEDFDLQIEEWIGDGMAQAGGYAEMRVYPPLNDTQVAAVSAELMSKWGIGS